MNANFLERKTAELGSKLSSLEKEFQVWTARSRAGRPLAKHQSQIDRITCQLGAFLAEVKRRLEGDPATLPARWRQLEVCILQLHRIWNFFRGKFAQRDVEFFQRYLRAADELAWACYEPAQRNAPEALIPSTQVKEPPLVFFNGGSSPLVTVRDRAFAAEEVTGEPWSDQGFTAALEHLPVPVVGIPWFQVEHLPDALIIAHEVGHAVDSDFKLNAKPAADFPGRLAAAGVPPGHLAAWTAWRAEIFADVFATLALGGAYAGALMDFLAVSPASVAAQRRVSPNWTIYPTVYLRILLVLETLRRRGLTAESDERAGEWRASYPGHAMPEFERDIPAVVAALAGVPCDTLGGLSVEGLFPDPAKRQADAKTVAENSLRGAVLPKHEVLTLIVGARRAFETDPAKYRSEEVSRKIIDRIIADQSSAPRGAGRRERPTPAQEAAEGVRLFHALAG